MVPDLTPPDKAEHAFAVFYTGTTGSGAVSPGRLQRTTLVGRRPFAAMTLFGLTMLSPALAVRLTAPIVAIGSRLVNRAPIRRGVPCY